MRLSEAIRLGSLAIQPQADNPLDGESGCALGMGFYATGCRTFSDMSKAVSNGQWNWMFRRVPTVRPTFCKCDEWSSRYAYIVLDDEIDYRGWIAHFFNEHIVRDAVPKMTLEHLCDQVRAWEDELSAKGVDVEQRISDAPALKDSARPGVEKAREKVGV